MDNTEVFYENWCYVCDESLYPEDVVQNKHQNMDLCQECFKGYEKFLCPLCGDYCLAEPGCPSYFSSTSNSWSGCYPPCGNDTHWFCSNGDCSWERHKDSKSPYKTEHTAPKWLEDRKHAD